MVVVSAPFSLKTQAQRSGKRPPAKDWCQFLPGLQFARWALQGSSQHMTPNGKHMRISDRTC